MKVLALLLAIVAVSYAANIDVTPSDAAAMVGTNINLTCQVSGDLSTERLTWKEHITNPIGVQIFNSAMSGPNDEEDYGIHGKYDLMIKNVEVEDGGWYSCGLDFQSQPYTTNVHVFERPTIIIPDMTVDHTSELECRVIYGSPPQAMLAPPQMPRMVAKIDMEVVEGKETRINGLPGKPSTIYYAVNLTAKAEDHLKSFSCEVILESPEYKIMEREILQVRHNAWGLEMVPVKEDYYVGETITCGATGYPEPNYRWSAVHSPGGRPVTGNKLEIKSAMVGHNEWKCEASNDIGSGMKTVEEKIEFMVVAATVPPAGSSAWNLQASAVVLLVGLINTML